MLFPLLPHQTAFTFMPRLSPRTALLSMRPDAALAHVFISFAPDGFIFTPSHPCCTPGLYCHLYRKLRTGEESGNARQRHFLTILSCFYDIMLVIVFCKRVFLRHCDANREKFCVSGKQEIAFRGAVCFCASALQKRENLPSK